MLDVVLVSIMCLLVFDVTDLFRFYNVWSEINPCFLVV